jgi:hypothetical protein
MQRDNVRRRCTIPETIKSVFAIESQLEREFWAANEPKGVTATSLI